MKMEMCWIVVQEKPFKHGLCMSSRAMADYFIGYKTGGRFATPWESICFTFRWAMCKCRNLGWFLAGMLLQLLLSGTPNPVLILVLAVLISLILGVE